MEQPTSSATFTDFCVTSFKTFAASSGNVIISPASIHVAFAMLAEGARDQVLAELQSFLKIDSTKTAQLVSVLKVMKNDNSII